MTKHETDEATGVDTTGHEWDGIKELNNPLPRWWLWCLYLTIIWGIGYMIAYPAWPMISGSSPSTSSSTFFLLIDSRACSMILTTLLISKGLAI